MSAPARTLRCSLRRHPAPVATAAAACPAAPTPWTPSSPAIERQRQPQRQQRRPLHSQSPNTHPPPSTFHITTLQATPAQPKPLPEVTLFNSHAPLLSPEPNHKPPDERKVKLGKTLRILQAHLPTLLQSPLPQQILSPHISLHLFPSTHPHLPAVSGRVAYIAALWSSPIAWNRVPLVGNVRLEILSERMVETPVYASLPGGRRPPGASGEQLIVRWRTLGGGARRLRGWLGFDGGKGKGREEETRGAGGAPPTDAAAPGTGTGTGTGAGAGAGPRADAAGASKTEVKAPVGMALPSGSTSKEFTGLFIFDFDGEGRILSHTIEHVHKGGQWEKGVGAKVVGLTDWLLGGIKGGNAPCPAFARGRFRKGGP